MKLLGPANLSQNQNSTEASRDRNASLGKPRDPRLGFVQPKLSPCGDDAGRFDNNWLCCVKLLVRGFVASFSPLVAAPSARMLRNRSRSICPYITFARVREHVIEIT